jgi:hypothetical protein
VGDLDAFAVEKLDVWPAPLEGYRKLRAGCRVDNLKLPIEYHPQSNAALLVPDIVWQ